MPAATRQVTAEDIIPDAEFALQRRQGEQWHSLRESITLAHTDSPIGLSR